MIRSGLKPGTLVWVLHPNLRVRQGKLAEIIRQVNHGDYKVKCLQDRKDSIYFFGWLRELSPLEQLAMCAEE